MKHLKTILVIIGIIFFPYFIGAACANYFCLNPTKDPVLYYIAGIFCIGLCYGAYVLYCKIYEIFDK